MTFFKNFLRDESGAAGVEYGLLVAAIAAVMVAIVFAIGGGVEDAFTEVCNSMNSATGISCAP